MSTVNRAIVLGRLGQDPEIRYLTNNTAVSSFSIATDHKVKDAEKSDTTWHRVVAFGRTSEGVAKRAKKGNQVYAEGRMVIRTYKDRQGVDQRAFEIHADKVLLLSGAPEEHEPETSHEPNAADKAREVAKKNIRQPSFDDLEDDVPF